MKPVYLSLKPLIPVLSVKRPIDWAKEFGNANPLDVEIGFGLGEFIVKEAQKNPNRNFIGIEQCWKRTQKTLRKIYVNEAANIRVFLADARMAFERLFIPQSLENVYCLFPCPWPKTGHEKHRLFSRDFLSLINSRLNQRGQIKIVTDHRSYSEWILEELPGTGFEAKINEIAPRYDTKFERKWLEQGQQKFLELQLLKRQHRNIPLKEDLLLKTYYVKTFDRDRFSPQDLKGDIAVIFKEVVYDPRRQKVMVRVVSAEENLTQHYWISITHENGSWRIGTTEGDKIIPTVAVAEALRLVHEAALAA